MRVTLVSGIEREPLGEASMLIILNDVVYVCTCSVRSDENKCKTKHALFYSHFKTLYQSKCCGDIIDNRTDAPIPFEDK